MDNVNRIINQFAEDNKIDRNKFKKKINDMKLNDEVLETLIYYQETINTNPFLVLVNNYYHQIKNFKENLTEFSEYGLQNELINLYLGMVNVAVNLNNVNDIKPFIKRLDENVNQSIKGNPEKIKKIRKQLVNVLKYNYIAAITANDYETGIANRIGGLCNKEVFLNIIEATSEEKNKLSYMEIRCDFPDVDSSKYNYSFIKGLKNNDKMKIKKIVHKVITNFENNMLEIFEDLEPLIDTIDYGLEAEQLLQVTKTKGRSSKNEKVKLDLFDLEKRLKLNIIGQNKQIEQFIKRIKVLDFGGLKEKGAKGVFLLAGPTGVGKTELAKLFSQNSLLPLIRMDMSEYKESHTISKILGSPPGYVGYHEQGNKVLDVVDQQKQAIILIDEIEKAHPEVLDVFLHIFDEGIAKDNRQNEIDFRECIFILTTNIGSVEAKKNTIGFQNDDSKKDKYEAAIEQRFRPEFINRIDEIIYFNNLKKEDVYQIIELSLKKIEDNLEQNQLCYEFILDQAGLDCLINKIDYHKYGARDIFRVLSEEVVPHLINVSETTKKGTIFISGKDELKINRIEPVVFRKTRKRKKK